MDAQVRPLDAGALPSVLTIRPLVRPPDVVVRVPGSKSLTNRAFVCAALADGRSRLTGVLFADDTMAMLDALTGLGADVVVDAALRAVAIIGADRSQQARDMYVNARKSGTTSRFVLPVLALSAGDSTIDGDEQLKARPFGPLFQALRDLGARVDELERPGGLPVRVTGPLSGGCVELPGHMTSQFLSGLMIAGPLMRDGLQVKLTTQLVSEPYMRMTAAVMATFGAEVELLADGLRVSTGSYQATDFAIEPDASAASYFMAAAAITGGRVTIPGLGRASLQGDVAFADLLVRMGARVEHAADGITIIGPPNRGDLRGIDVDLVDISDTAQTLAAVAAFATTPTRVRGIGFIRGKETNRIGAVVTELRRAGVDATEHDDGFTINPSRPMPAEFCTYEDHRMAMSLSLLGLRVPGIRLRGPGCVAKTYPGFFDDLAKLH